MLVATKLHRIDFSISNKEMIVRNSVIHYMHSKHCILLNALFFINKHGSSNPCPSGFIIFDAKLPKLSFC